MGGALSFAAALIHPIAMTTITIGWVLTWFMGVNVRKRRGSLPIPTEENGAYSEPAQQFWSSHRKLSAGLFLATMLFTLTGTLNTIARNGVIKPGPHFFGALAFFLFASTNNALVPWLKERPVSRDIHMIIGVTLLFSLSIQVYSGIKILIGLAPELL